MTILKDKDSQLNMRDLAEYGLLRTEAEEKVKRTSKPETDFFRIHSTNDGTSILANISLETENTGEFMVGVLVPEHESFDLIAQKDFSKQLKLTKPEKLRGFLRKLLDSV